MTKHFFRVVLPTAAVTAVISTTSHFVQAQQPTFRLPSSAEPGRELQQQKALEPAPSMNAIAVPEAPAVRAPAGAEKFSFTLASVDIEGATIYSREQLESHYRSLIGQKITVADVFAFAAAIENQYRSDGYVITRAIVPEQQIENGKVRVLIVEGFISQIRYEGDIGPARSKVEALLSSLSTQKPVTIAAIERSLLLANDLEGIQVRGTLEPSATERGAATLIVESERKAADAGITVDNRNSPFNGRNEVLLNGSLNSFGPNADTLYFGAKSAFPYRREHLWQLGYKGNFGSDGLTAGATALMANSQPGESLAPLDPDSDVYSGALNTSYPLIRSRLQNLRIDGSFEYNNLNTDIIGEKYTRDRLRVLRLGLEYDRTDDTGINAARATLSQGLDIFGASERDSQYLSRPDGRSDFTKLNLQVARVQLLPADFSIALSATAQWSSQSLLASEQIGLGGPDFGRAYDTSEVSGDKGIDGLVELRYSPAIAGDWIRGTQFFAYYDLGKVWNNDDEIPDTQSLASAGAGVRVRLPQNFSASVEVAQPLTHDIASEEGRPTRVFFSLSTFF
jgi:hemolysin activation/secretion protein